MTDVNGFYEHPLARDRIESKKQPHDPKQTTQRQEKSQPTCQENPFSGLGNGALSLVHLQHVIHCDAEERRSRASVVLMAMLPSRPLGKYQT